jgi:hypothetical protein
MASKYLTSEPDETRYEISASGVITSVDEAWSACALQNSARHLLAKNVIGTPIWEYISDCETRELYRHIIARAREREDVIAFPFRCDAPEVVRHMRMEVWPLPDGGVQFRSHVVARRMRAAQEILDTKTARSSDVLRMCSWCKKVLMPTNTWVEVEAAVMALELFGAGPLPALSHGVCPSCLENMRREPWA